MSEPLVLLHGVMDTSRTWDLVRPRLERHHEILAPTLLGHHGGPPSTGAPTPAAIADQVERDMDAAGLDTVHIAGNSLGGSMALELAARGRARTVVAFAPAGGWADDESGRAESERVREYFATAQQLLANAAPYAAQIASTPEGRARALAYVSEHPEVVPEDLVAHQITGAANCPIVLPLIDHVFEHGYELSGTIECPVRIAWGTEDKILRWPSASVKFRELIPHADWVEMDGIGHCPQLDDPIAAAELILGFTKRR